MSAFVFYYIISPQILNVYMTCYNLSSSLFETIHINFVTMGALGGWRSIHTNVALRLHRRKCICVDENAFPWTQGHVYADAFNHVFFQKTQFLKNHN